jgi:hypothetical protein
MEYVRRLLKQKQPGCCRTLKMSLAASLPVSVCMM